MAWSVTGSMAFGAFAAVVQLVFAGILLTRNPRNERVVLFGLLFLCNGLASVATFAAGGYPEVRDLIAGNSPPLAVAFARTSFFLESATNLLLLLLALVYPRRVAWLRRAPPMWVVFAALVAGMFVLRLAFGSVLSVGRSASVELTAVAALVSYGLVDLAFPLLMVRWALIWRESMPSEMRTQFALVFAAIGVRAVHQMIFVPFIEVSDVVRGRAFTPVGVAIGGLIVAIVVGGLIASAIILATARSRLAPREKQWQAFVVGFLLFGALEGALNIFLNRGLQIGWWAQLTGDFDTLVIRPVLLWYAITRTHFLDIRLRSGQLAWVMAFVLTAAAVMGGVYEAFGERGSPAVQWSLSAIVGIAVASATVAVWQAVLLARSEAWSRSPSPSEVYAAQLEEAHRNGVPAAMEVRRLQKLREQLGIDDAMHRAVERRIMATGLAQNAPVKVTK